VLRIMKLDPRDRPTARQLLDDEWFHRNWPQFPLRNLVYGYFISRHDKLLESNFFSSCWHRVLRGLNSFLEAWTLFGCYEIRPCPRGGLSSDREGYSPSLGYYRTGPSWWFG
jgi:hypothetical protein